VTDTKEDGPGWNLKRLQAVARRYDNQTDDEAVAEMEWIWRRDDGELVMSWIPYDPTWLVRLATLHAPEEPWLAEALAKCTRTFVDSHGDDCLYFVDPSRPNEPGSEWQFVSNIILDNEPTICPDRRDIVLDVLTDRRIGGLEFFS
jgi:hypothetical protein